MASTCKTPSSIFLILSLPKNARDELRPGPKIVDCQKVTWHRRLGKGRRLSQDLLAGGDDRS
jgi:hypothetical protein